MLDVKTGIGVLRQKSKVKARFECKQRKVENDISVALGGAEQRATARRQSARAEHVCPYARPYVRIGYHFSKLKIGSALDPQTEPFEERSREDQENR